jgi:competence protein ComEA
MIKKFISAITMFAAMLYAAASFAAVDVNKATAAELDGVKGIGPAISTKIMDERKKGNFKDWNDFIDRVKGIGEKNAPKFSEAGLTVNGAAFAGAPAAKADAKPAAAKKDDKPVAKADAKAAAPAAAVDPKADAKAKAAADKQAKADAKAKDKAEKAAAKEKAKADKAAAKEAKSAKPAAKADAKPDAKPAADAKK